MSTISGMFEKQTKIIGLQQGDKTLLSPFENGNYELVIKRATKKIKKGKEDVLDFLLRGLSYKEQGKYELATNDFLTAKNLTSFSPSIEKILFESKLDLRAHTALQKYFSGDQNPQLIFEIGALISKRDIKDVLTSAHPKFSDYSDLYLKLIEEAGACETNHLAQYVFRHLREDQNVSEAISLFLTNHEQSRQEEVIEKLTDNKLFNAIIRYDICIEKDFEFFVRALRRFFISPTRSEKFIALTRELIISISIQMYLNEYIYDISEYEEERIEQLARKTSTAIKNGVSPNANELTLIALYKDISFLDFDIKADELIEITPLLKLQIGNKWKEEALVNSFNKNSSIADKISKKVRKQYEENPYPRWYNLHFPHKPFELHNVLRAQNICLANNEILRKNELKTLVAGCGTGRQPIELAKTINGLSIDALDLSMSSLCYAKRRATELKIKNINFIHSDILNLHELEKTYDYIECIGVLHHMESPEQALHSLTQKLNKNGLLKLGLYSSLARRNIKKIQQLAKEENLTPNLKTIRQFREFLRFSFKDNEQYKSLLSLADFHSTSMFRDLFFHQQEKTFNIQEIKTLIAENNLIFCGFAIPNRVWVQISEHFITEDDIYNLNKWSTLEETYPDLFISMYNFYCQKNA